jgi:hypothetical protein
MDPPRLEGTASQGFEEIANYPDRSGNAQALDLFPQTTLAW